MTCKGIHGLCGAEESGGAPLLLLPAMLGYSDERRFYQVRTFSPFSNPSSSLAPQSLTDTWGHTGSGRFGDLPGRNVK